MELKLTTLRALAFEEKTGKDLLKFIQGVSESNEIGLKDIIELFIALGKDYTIEMFDAWDLPLLAKTEAILKAVEEYIQGKNPIASS